MDLIFNSCGEFRWSPEGPVGQINTPHLHDGAPGIFSDLLRQRCINVTRGVISPHHLLLRYRFRCVSVQWRTCIVISFILSGNRNILLLFMKARCIVWYVQNQWVWLLNLLLEDILINFTRRSFQSCPLWLAREQIFNDLKVIFLTNHPTSTSTRHILSDYLVRASYKITKEIAGGCKPFSEADF